MKKSNQGFTLIEILIVVAIIAILASVVLVGLGPTQRAGRDARRISDLRSVQNGLELFFNKCGYYPGTISGGTCATTAPGSWTELGAALTGVGVNNLPNDPNSNASYGYAILSSGSGYVVGAALEDPNNGAFSNYSSPIPGAGTVTWIRNSAASVYPADDCVSAPAGLSGGKTYCLSL
jgi:general secretion pathway protein G